jgi:hypothetical protein
MSDRAFAERRLPLLMSVERFIRPERVENDSIVGRMWSTDLCREVPVRASMPRGMDADQALRAAADGALVLDRSLRRLTRARG